MAGRSIDYSRFDHIGSSDEDDESEDGCPWPDGAPPPEAAAAAAARAEAFLRERGAFSGGWRVRLHPVSEHGGGRRAGVVNAAHCVTPPPPLSPAPPSLPPPPSPQQVPHLEYMMTSYSPPPRHISPPSLRPHLNGTHEHLPARPLPPRNRRTRWRD